MDIQFHDNTKARIINTHLENNYQKNDFQNSVRAQTDIYNWLFQKDYSERE